MPRLLAIGEVVGDRFRVASVLGRGGTSTTYVAEDLVTRHPVALKQLGLWGGDGSWKALELFEREARVLAALSHPGIPRYVAHFQAEREDGPVFFIAQEMASGHSLDSRVRAGWEPTEAQVRHIALQLLEIAEYLQARVPPVIHRDIKPANVIIDDRGSLRLVDFGAARDTQRGTGQGSTLIGTYGYMAPEQLWGHATTGTDVYGIAATCAFLLTRAPPEQLGRKRSRPDFRARSKVSSAFAAWLDRALEPEPDKRFRSARDARDALLTPPRVTLRRVASLTLVGAVTAVGTTLTLRWFDGREEQPAATRAPLVVAGEAEATRGRLKLLRELQAHHTGTFRAVFSPDGRRIYAATQDGAAKSWDVASGKLLLSFPAPEQKVTGVEVTPDGRTLVLVTVTALVVYDAETAKELRRIPGPGYYGVALSPDGKRLAATRRTGGVVVMSVEGGDRVELPHPGPVLGAAFSPDGRLLATAGHDPKLRVWNLGTRKAVEISAHAKPMSQVVFTPDGKLLATASDDLSVRTWWVDGGKEWRRFEGFPDEAWAVAVSPDGTIIAGGSKDGTIRLWDQYSGKLIDVVHVNDGVVGLSFSPDGRMLVAASRKVWLWTVREPVWQPPRIESPVLDTEPIYPAEMSEEQKLCRKADWLMHRADGNRKVLANAEELLRRALTQNPKSALAYAGLGRFEYKRGFLRKREYDPASLERAHRHLDRALELDPKLVLAHVRKGYVCHFQRDEQGAKKWVGSARALDPRDPGLLLLSAELAEDARPDEALLHARSLFESTSDREYRLGLYNLLTGIYVRLQEWEAADNTYRSCLNLEPKSPWARVNYAAFLKRRGDYDGAIAMCKAALELADFGMAHYQLATALALKAVVLIRDKKDAKEAESLLDRAAKEFPSTAEEIFGRGLLALHGGDETEARRLFNRALEIEPKYPAVRFELERLDRKRTR